MELAPDKTLEAAQQQQAEVMALAATAIVDALAVKQLKCEIIAVSTVAGGRMFAKIRRAGNTAPDEKQYPVVSAAIKPVVGMWVTGLDTPGGIIILGAETKTADPDVVGLADGSDILDNALYWRHIFPNSLIGSNIAFATLTWQHIAAASITGDRLAPSTVTGDKILDRTLWGASKLAVGSVTGTEIANISIWGADKLAFGSVSDSRLALSYAAASHNHAGVYSPSGHGHGIGDLSGVASSSHNHSGVYATANHGHGNDYAATNHGHGTHRHTYTYVNAAGQNVQGNTSLEAV